VAPDSELGLLLVELICGREPQLASHSVTQKARSRRQSLYGVSLSEEFASDPILTSLLAERAGSADSPESDPPRPR